MTWRTGDAGLTRGHLSYRVIADDAKGDRGPLVALVRVADEEMVYRYGADGVHSGAPRVYDLMPVPARAPS